MHRDSKIRAILMDLVFTKTAMFRLLLKFKGMILFDRTLFYLMSY